MATLTSKPTECVSRASGIVNLLMFRVGQKLKVLRPVVQLVTVDVVNLFARIELAPNRLLDNEDVLSAPTRFQRVDASIAAGSQAVLGLYARLIQPEIVSLRVRIPVSLARLAHLLFLGFGFRHTGEVCAMFSALYPKLNQAIPYGVAMNSKLSRDGFQRAIGILFFEPFGGRKLFYGAHCNMSPLYSMGVTS